MKTDTLIPASTAAITVFTQNPCLNTGYETKEEKELLFFGKE